LLLFVPEGNFKFFVLEKQIGPLCTGGCEKLVSIAEILVTLGVLRSPARFFLNKRCSFDMRDSETTVLVTLYILSCYIIHIHCGNQSKGGKYRLIVFVLHSSFFYKHHRFCLSLAMLNFSAIWASKNAYPMLKICTHQQQIWVANGKNCQFLATWLLWKIYLNTL